MIASLLALSLSNTLQEIGALAAFAALLGIAVLSLLVFAQARELKRLREWAGRAPERAAELEQRVSAEAAARAQRVVQPRGGAVPVPRTTPVVARAVQPGTPGAESAAAVQPAPVGSDALPGSPSPGVPAPGATPASPVPASPTSPVPASPVPATAAAETRVPDTPPRPGQPAFVPTAQAASAAPVASNGPGSPSAPAAAEQDLPAGAELPAGAASSQEQITAKPEIDPAARIPAVAAVAAATGRVASGASEQRSVAEAATSGPATVAARVGAPARAPVPPSPEADRQQSSARAPLPPAPGSGAHARPAAAGMSAAPRAATRPPGRPPAPRFLKEEERSPRRATALIVGGVVFGVAVLVGVLLSLGGGSSPKQSTSAARTGTTGRHSHRTHRSAARTAASPAETHVVVLNGTETNGLAHRISANLQQGGYTLAAALDAHPAGRATSVVEYAEGHRAEAEHVAQTLGVSQVQALESAVAPLIEGASVVVIAGADQAALGSEG